MAYYCLLDQWLNKEHVAWYSYQTLKQLLKRKGFREIMYSYYYGENKSDILKNTQGFIGKLRLLKRKLIGSRTKEKNYNGLFFIAGVDDI